MNGPLLPHVFPPSALALVSGSAAGGDPHYGGLLGACLAAAGLLVLVSMAAASVAVQALAPFLRRKTTAFRTRNLTPEGIVNYRGPARGEATPELVSRRIVERSEQIRRALEAQPSQIEVTMCAMGYSACRGDLLALCRMVGDRYPACGPVRQIEMRVALRRAADSLARARKAFPAHARTGPSGVDA